MTPPGRESARSLLGPDPRSRSNGSRGFPPWLLWRALDRHLVAGVDLLDPHVDALLAGGGDVLADVVGADRQLAMAPVDKRRQLDPGGATVVEDRVDRGAHGATGVEHVVDDHDRAAVHRELEV